MFYPIPIPRIASKQAFCKFNFPNSIPLKLYLIVTNYDIITSQKIYDVKIKNERADVVAS